MRILLSLVFISLFCSGTLFAQDESVIDESAMFGDDAATVADSTTLVNTTAGKEAQSEKQGLSVSGEMTSADSAGGAVKSACRGKAWLR